MRNMNDSLSALCRGHVHNWCDYVHGVQAAYNHTPHAATYVAPYQLLFGRAPPPLVNTRHVVQSKLATQDALLEAARLQDIQVEQARLCRERLESAWVSRALTYNQNRHKTTLVVGDRCLAQLNPAQQRLATQEDGKLRVRWSEPLLVTAVRESGKAFECTDGLGRKTVVNATKLTQLPPSSWQPKRPITEFTWDDKEMECYFPGNPFSSANVPSGESSSGLHTRPTLNRSFTSMTLVPHERSTVTSHDASSRGSHVSHSSTTQSNQPESGRDNGGGDEPTDFWDEINADTYLSRDFTSQRNDMSGVHRDVQSRPCHALLSDISADREADTPIVLLSEPVSSSNDSRRLAASSRSSAGSFELPSSAARVSDSEEDVSEQ